MILRLADRRTRLGLLGVAGGFGVYFGLYAVAALTRPEPFRFGDFFALWSYGQVLAREPAADLYDPPALIARQVALGMPASISNPFPYPPGFMPVVWPLGFLPYDAAYVLFMGATLALFLVAVALAAPRPRVPAAVMALLAPASILTLVAGQSGFLAGALFLGGMRLVAPRPLLGGVLLGLLAYKPQLGVLVPVALVAAGRWRAIGAAAATVAAVALATSAAFGWRIWADWLAYLPAYSAQFARESSLDNRLMPTLTAGAAMFGLPAAAVHPAQLALAALAAAWVWRSARRDQGARATLVLALATFLATPHAFIYDLPMLAGAAVIFAAARLRDGPGLTGAEAAALLLALSFPALMVHVGARWPLGVVSLGLVAAALVVPGLGAAGRGGSRAAPSA